MDRENEGRNKKSGGKRNVFILNDESSRGILRSSTTVTDIKPNTSAGDVSLRSDAMTITGVRLDISRGRVPGSCKT